MSEAHKQTAELAHSALAELQQAACRDWESEEAYRGRFDEIHRVIDAYVFLADARDHYMDGYEALDIVLENIALAYRRNTDDDGWDVGILEEVAEILSHAGYYDPEDTDE